MNSASRFRSNNPNRFERRSRERARSRDRFRRSRSASPRNRFEHVERNNSRLRTRYSPYENRVKSRSPRPMRFSPPRRDSQDRFHEREERSYEPVYEPPQRPYEDESHEVDWRADVREALENENLEEDWQVDNIPERDLRNQLNQNKRNYMSEAGQSSNRWNDQGFEDICYTNDNMDLTSPDEEGNNHNREPNYQENAAPWHFIKGDGHPDIPTFSGENQELTSREFLKIFEEVALLQNWNMEEKKIQLGAKLVGAARDWFFRDDKVTDSWGRIKRSLLLTFLSDMDYYQALHKMIQRTKTANESYNNYFTFKAMQLKTVGIFGRKAVSCIIGGLEGEDLKTKCYKMNFSNPEQLYSFLMELGPQEPPKVSKPAIPPLIPFIQQPHQLFRENQKERDRLKKCFICQERGHISVNCPKQDKPIIQQQAQQQQLKGKDKNSLNIIINGTQFRAFNDIKSEVVTIRQEQANMAKINYNREKRVVWGYKGALINTIGDGNVLIRIQNVVVNVQIFVVTNSSQDVPVVIGNTLRHHKDINYVSDGNNVEFQIRTFQPPQNSSFHMNEVLVNKANNSNQQKKKY